MKKFIILFIVIFVQIFVYEGCQQQPEQKATVQKETSKVSITVKNPNAQESPQETEQTAP